MNENIQWLNGLNTEISKLGIAAEPQKTDKELPTFRRRKMKISHDELTMTIVEQDGVLFIEEGAVGGTMPGKRRRGPREIGLTGDVLQTTPLSTLKSNQIGSALTSLDERLTPNQGLRELKNGKLVPTNSVRKTGKIFLIVHGTFSNSDNILKQIPDADNGSNFLNWLNNKYDQVLAFDHPTLGLSPLLNAYQLHNHLKDTKASIDTVCHSRGGLVTRWWLEGLDISKMDKRRTIFVAAPLNGTGLAAPPNIKNSLSLLLNYGRVLQAGSSAASAIPFMAVVSGLFRILNGVTSLMAKTPVLDAAVALVPGLSAMSRVSNNFELLQLREHPDLTRNYFAVRSNFEPASHGWKFWKSFRSIPDRFKNSAADLVFDGKNDLVVDTPSMSNFSDQFKFPYKQVLDFKTSATVHHTNYFEQKHTLDFIMKSFN